MKTNFHTHTYLCGHATGEIEDYIKEAIAKDYKILGLSDHGPLTNPPFYRMSKEQFEKDYVEKLDELIIKYQDKIKILKGVEIEYVEDDLDYLKYISSKLDYMILAPHYYVSKNLNSANSAYHCDTHEKLLSYLSVIEKGLGTNLFRILAHPDIFMISYRNLDEFAKDICRKIIRLCKEHNVLIELNANGLRDSRDLGYPNIQFFEIVKEENAKVIIGSDCHNPSDLDDEYMHEARLIASKLGLDVVEKI